MKIIPVLAEIVWIQMDRARIEASNILAHLESDMRLRRKAALIIGVFYLASALSVAIHPHSLWDIGTFLVLTFAGNFLIVVGLNLNKEKS